MALTLELDGAEPSLALIQRLERHGQPHTEDGEFDLESPPARSRAFAIFKVIGTTAPARTGDLLIHNQAL